VHSVHDAVAGPHIGPGTTNKIAETLLRGKEGRNLQKSNRGGSLSKMDQLHTARSNGPYETWSLKDSGEEAELIMCDGEIKSHP